MPYEFVINIGFPDSSQMITLFRYLESNKDDLGVSISVARQVIPRFTIRSSNLRGSVELVLLQIESMGASVTTMEDVFLKVGQREEDLSPTYKEESSFSMFGEFPGSR